MQQRLSVLEICAGAGGQAFGLEQAGFDHELAVEIDGDACATLHSNRPTWKIHEGDVREVPGRDFRGIDVVAGGVPCPPFSIAGKQLGADDERDLFPEALRLVREARPRGVLLENVRGLATRRFDGYRGNVIAELGRLGYQSFWNVINASEYGVPQLRPRFILVALREGDAAYFGWPEPLGPPPTVGEALADLISERGWAGAEEWSKRANAIAPTIVGGSKKHGGPDLGPSRAKAAWSLLGVNGLGIADDPPAEDFPLNGMPKLTVRMVARIQGFSDEWRFAGRKTSAYRQVGNAFPPPVAKAVGQSIRDAFAGILHLSARPQQPDLFETRGKVPASA